MIMKPTFAFKFVILNSPTVWSPLNSPGLPLMPSTDPDYRFDGTKETKGKAAVEVTAFKPDLVTYPYTCLEANTEVTAQMTDGFGKRLQDTCPCQEPISGLLVKCHSQSTPQLSHWDALYVKTGESVGCNVTVDKGLPVSFSLTWGTSNGNTVNKTAESSGRLLFVHPLYECF